MPMLPPVKLCQSEPAATSAAVFRGFLPLSFSDYAGQMAAVLFTGGCNMRCRFCYNKPLVLSPEDQPPIAVDDVLAQLKERAGFLDAVVVTGGEPTLMPWLPDFLGRLRALDLLVGLDTNGTRPEVVETLLQAGLIDRLAVDYKAPRAGYPGVTEWPVHADPVKPAGDGCDLWPAVFETLKLAATCRGNPSHEIRLTLHPDLQSPDEVAQMGVELARSGVSRMALQTFKPWEVLDPALSETPGYDRAALTSFIPLFKGEVLIR